MDSTGNTRERSASLGLKLGLVAALLFIVAASLLWHHVYRDPVALATSRPEADRLLVVRLDGSSRPAPSSDSRSAQGSQRGGKSRPSPAVRPRPAPPPPPPPPPAPQSRKYEVRKGDCLSMISNEIYGTSKRWQEIAEANDMAPPYELREGMILDIP